MDPNIVPVLAIIASIIIVVLNYWKELKMKKESELYLKKLKFYEDLIDLINKVFYHEDTTRGRDLVKFYNKSFIFSDDRVINDFNELLDRINFRDEIPYIELKDIYAKILLDIRHDLGIATKFNVDGFDYKVPIE